MTDNQMTDNQDNMTPQQKYYHQRKEDPEFLNKRREIARKSYHKNLSTQTKIDRIDKKIIKLQKKLQEKILNITKNFEDKIQVLLQDKVNILQEQE